MSRKKFIQMGGSKEPIARCANPMHKFTLSKQQMKSKKCLEKQCPYLVRFKQMQFWIDREKRKEEKRMRKLEAR